MPISLFLLLFLLDPNVIETEVDTIPPDPWYRPDRIDPDQNMWDNNPSYGQDNLVPEEKPGVMTNDDIDNTMVDLPDSLASDEKKKETSENKDIDVWTIYIIVGSVAGGVLLIGVVAIIVALCCNRYEDEGYKHTNV